MHALHCIGCNLFFLGDAICSIYIFIYKVINVIYFVLVNSLQYALHSMCCIIENICKKLYALYTLFLMFSKMLHVA